MGQVIDITAMVARPEKWPNRIREHRKALGWTLEDLAERMATTAGPISRFETGVRPIDLAWMRRFAVALGVTVADLLSADDNPLNALDDEQRYVVDTMIAVGSTATRTLHRVAEGVREWHAEPPAESGLKRA